MKIAQVKLNMATIQNELNEQGLPMFVKSRSLLPLYRLQVISLSSLESIRANISKHAVIARRKERKLEA